MKKIIVAIDGHSSCGKSTLARALGRALHYRYISTGDMYRAVALFFIENKISLTDIETVKMALKKISLLFETDESGSHILLNGQRVSDEIRKMYVTEWVSPVAAIPEVRKEMVRQQQEIGRKKGVIMDGRDIGTVVFPDAELKIFLTADTDERARRRYTELIEKGQSVSYEEVKRNLIERDHIDSTRSDSPLKMAEDSILLDNTHLNQEQQLAIALSWAQEKIHQ